MANRDLDRINRELREWEQALKGLAQRFQRAMQSVNIHWRAVDILGAIPGSPKHPIQFTTDRQRKAFFASGGFGRGIPTQRTGKIAGDWQVQFIPTQDGEIMVLSNPHDEAKFIHGPQPFAQGFHIDTGWKQVEDVEEIFFAQAEGVATQVFFNEVDPFEGL